MKQVLEVRELIYDQFHGSTAGPSHFFNPANADDYATYYTPMYLIQDTGEAISAHMGRGFSHKPLQAYIEFWGVMQAVLIQQDAICELYRAVLERKINTLHLLAWRELRNTRNLCAGHPANRSHGRPKPQRAFMGRNFGTYNHITYEMWDANTQQRSHPTFDLYRLIHQYDSEASKILEDVLRGMKSKWP